MAAEIPLDRLQRWMKEVVVHSGSLDEAVHSPKAEAELTAGEIANIVLPSRTLSPVERVGIYHGMYLLRLGEALESDYPAVAHFLGQHRWEHLVAAYLDEFPSRSYSLNFLGDAMPEFLLSREGLARKRFLHELARLELAITKVFDAPECSPLTAEAISAVPEEAWEGARLRPVEAFRILDFRYPVNSYLQSVKEENHDHPRVRRMDNWVAVYRKNFAVWRLELTRPAFELLSALSAGEPLGSSVERISTSGRGRRALREDELFRFFRDWISEGIFQSIEI